MIKSAAQILAGQPRPVDVTYRLNRKGIGGRPPLHRECQLPDCDKPHWGNGFCRPHGRAFNRYGDPYGSYVRPKKCTCVTCPVHIPDAAEEL